MVRPDWRAAVNSALTSARLLVLCTPCSQPRAGQKVLTGTRLADDLLDVMGHIAGGVRGGMGVGIILFGVLMGATTGIVGATIITLGLLTLPTLIARHPPDSVGRLRLPADHENTTSLAPASGT